MEKIVKFIPMLPTNVVGSKRCPAPRPCWASSMLFKALDIPVPPAATTRIIAKGFQVIRLAQYPHIKRTAAAINIIRHPPVRRIALAKSCCVAREFLKGSQCFCDALNIFALVGFCPPIGFD